MGMTASRALRVEAQGCICSRLLQRVLAGRLLFGLEGHALDVRVL